MKALALSLLVIGVTTSAAFAEPAKLTEAQMDGVTAGVDTPANVATISLVADSLDRTIYIAKKAADQIGDTVPPPAPGKP